MQGRNHNSLELLHSETHPRCFAEDIAFYTVIKCVHTESWVPEEESWGEPAFWRAAEVSALFYFARWDKCFKVFVRTISCLPSKNVFYNHFAAHSHPHWMLCMQHLKSGKQTAQLLLMTLLGNVLLVPPWPPLASQQNVCVCFTSCQVLH